MGKIINRNYELLQLIGQGGMGEVYKARHLHFGTIVAVKKLWTQYSRDEEIRKRFLEEAKNTFSFQHPGIVKTNDLIEFEDEYYIIMEYVNGRTLSDVIHKEVGPIETARALHLFKQIASAIEYIHKLTPPVIHRDIKPQNIIVTSEDEVKLTDFGIAKVLMENVQKNTLMKGTPVYMSPEQIMTPSTVDQRSDIYSLGMTLYEMLCGRTPFDRVHVSTPAAVHAEVVNGKIPPPTNFYPGIPVPLTAIVMKALDKDPQNRFLSVGDMISALLDFERELPSPVPPKQEKPNKEKSVRKLDRGSLIFGISTLLFLALMITVGITRKSRDVDPPSVAVDHPIPTKVDSMILVKGGQFYMGCTSNLSECDSSEFPPHLVGLNSFYLGRTEVTQEQWMRVMGKNPSSRKGDSLPVESVSWLDAVEFCNRLSELSGLKKAYSGYGDNITCDFMANGYRLPTEAEWEYAARGGITGRSTILYSGSNEVDEVAWYSQNSSGYQQPVGQKKANELGLLDMSGNVWEWCWDIKGNYTAEEEQNPHGAPTGDRRVLRGGGWSSNPRGCRVSARSGNKPGIKAVSIGFRLAQSIVK